MLVAAAALFVHLYSPLGFDFKDPKGVNAVSFSTDGALEPFVGVAKGVSGTLQFDPAAPAATKGTITVDSDSLTLPLKPLEDSMKADWCLDAKGHPTIEFKIDRLEKVTKQGENRYTALVDGSFTMKGVTKPLRVHGSASYYPHKAKERFGDKDGDLLVIRTDFEINRRDFGVGKGLGENYVSNVVTVHVALVGTSIRQ